MYKTPKIAQRYQKNLTIACIALIVIAVIVLVRYFNVFWFDFHLALIGLFLHLKLERVTDPFQHFLRKIIDVFRRYFGKLKQIGKLSSNPAKKNITNSTNGNRL